LIIDARVIRDKLDVGKIVEELARETASLGGGAIVVFMGFVKGIVDDHKVYRLDYDAYEPYAFMKLREIAWEEGVKHGLLGVKVYHRVGSLEPGEPTIYIIVASKSRHEAFEAASAILERVKREAPIFKLEHRDNGSYWVVGDERVKRMEGS